MEQDTLEYIDDLGQHHQVETLLQVPKRYRGSLVVVKRKPSAVPAASGPRLPYFDRIPRFDPDEVAFESFLMKKFLAPRAPAAARQVQPVSRYEETEAAPRGHRGTNVELIVGLIGVVIYSKSSNFIVRLSIGTLIGIWLFMYAYSWVTTTLVLSVLKPG